MARFAVWGLVVSFIAGASALPAHAADPADPFVWLEEYKSPAALDWVAAHNKKSLGELQGDRRFDDLAPVLRRIYSSTDRIATPSLRAAGEWIYNFWQDSTHPRGIWRRTTPEEYRKASPAWQILLDVDALGKQEQESWVYKSSDCLEPAAEHCLVTLSRGGQDASVVREFDLRTRSFLGAAQGGFILPEAKSTVAWMDQDHLLVATDYGPGSMTTSGYPRIVKLWQRGTPLSEARTLLEGSVNDVSAQGYGIFRPEGNLFFVGHSPSFFEEELSLVRADGTLAPLPTPHDASFQGAFQGHLLFQLRSSWKPADRVYESGSLVSLPVADILAGLPVPQVEPVFMPDARSTLESVATSSNAVYVGILRNVQGQVLRYEHGAAGWESAPLALPAGGMSQITSADAFAPRIYASHEDFLAPSSLYELAGDRGAAPRLIRQLPAWFDASQFEVEQREARSRDGVKIPYFLVHARGMKLDGRNPTLLYGYGGFEVSMTPGYVGARGPAWLQKGGVYALANIRGGGEFGPRWHQAAMRTHRQRAYDDFIGVAQDLIARGVTSPSRLGIQGGSNGGLLVGAVFVERPELFHAVICEVPLLDMRRYTLLGAGSSWISEYGDPNDPKMWAAIGKYSPYQNIRAQTKYPRVFFLTSTEDDRVTPAHARKMTARMEQLGHDALFFENTEGGHGAAADIEQRVRMSALEYTYLHRMLMEGAR